MKLLKLEIGNLPKEKQFRSLHPGFKVEFHKLCKDEKLNNFDEKGIKAMEVFSPFCFAGLNGSGKSNVLEALAAIFFHLECCVAKFKPNTFEKHFRTNECNPDAFMLEYLIGQHNNKPYALAYFDKIIIRKKEGEAPKMFRQAFPFTKNEKETPVSLIPRKNLIEPRPADGKVFLPDIVVGYSSGENEILSLPFRKSRLINFDKYREDYIRGYRFEDPENSLIYIDNEMSQAVLLVCLLYEDEETLKPLREELGIVGIRSFRMNLNVQSLVVGYNEDNKTRVPILQHIPEIIEDLKKCASSWQEFKHEIEHSEDHINSVLTLDFFVDEHTKTVFKKHFSTSFELFRFFQVLYELNSNVISESIKEEVYKSRGFYTDGKIPEGSPNENVFYFLDYLILKKIEGEKEPKPLLLREFSDGEHQFLHIMGICLMLKEKRSLLLFDEPETHFNPSWRAKFIKVLNNSLKAGGTNNFLKDVILTSHSPFIISDCLPNNVIFFKRNKNIHKIEAKSAREMEFNTYGTSVEIILDELFEYNQSIGDWANEELKSIDFENIKTKEDKEAIKKELKILGESIEKDLVLAKLNRIKFE